MVGDGGGSSRGLDEGVGVGVGAVVGAVVGAAVVAGERVVVDDANARGGGKVEARKRKVVAAAVDAIRLTLLVREQVGGVVLVDLGRELREGDRGGGRRKAMLFRSVDILVQSD